MSRNPCFYNNYKPNKFTDISWAPINFLIFNHLTKTVDPEYPLTLSDLGILKLEHIEVVNQNSSYLTIQKISFFPTFGQCKLAPLLGITIFFLIQSKITIKKLVKIYHRNWLPVFKINLDNNVHAIGENITRQLNDTERLSAALENNSIRLSALRCIKK